MKYIAKIEFAKTISDLQDIVSLLEHEIDHLQQITGGDHEMKVIVRERVLYMIDLIANVEKDLIDRLNRLVADYLGDIYIELANIENCMVGLHRRSKKGTDSPDDEFDY
jgi:hypothetical protein